MALNIDEFGNITMFQGDSGSLVINGLNTDKNYSVFLAIQDKNRNFVGGELQVNSNKQPSVVFEMTGDYTDFMTVPKNSDFEVYYYGVKICSADGEEETLLIGNSQIGVMNTITVFPKKVEGV